MEKYEIALFYHLDDEVDANETFEDIQSELDCFGIEYERQKGKKLKIDDVYVTFLPFNLAGKKTYQSLYTSQNFKKEYGEMINQKSEKVTYHTRPFQNLIDIVLEVKTRAENKPKQTTFV